MRKKRALPASFFAGIMAAGTAFFLVLHPGITARADPEEIVLEDSVTEAAPAFSGEIPAGAASSLPGEIPPEAAAEPGISGTPGVSEIALEGEAPRTEETEASLSETEAYREDFMEDLGQEDLEALLSGSEEETISEQELQEMVNEWMQEDTSAGLSGSGGKKFTVQDDPDTILEYDRDRGEYVYILPDGNEYRMNVPRDAVHVGPVTVTTPDGGFIGMIKRDGEAYYQEETTFTEPGSYELEYYSGGIDTSGGVNVDRIDTAAMGTTRSHIRFRIIPQSWNGAGPLTPPEDFSLVSAELDGESMPTGYEFRLRDDGLYHLVYAFGGDESIRYELEFTSDRTAPEIRLTPPVDGTKKSRPPVAFEVIDPEARVRVMKDGTLVETPGQRIEEGGWYAIIATDPAGNETEKSFYLQYGMSRELKLLMGALLAAAAGVLIWLLVIRLKPRVR